MLSKIKRLIKTYNKKINIFSNELRELAKNDDYEAYVALFKERALSIDMVIDLENIVK